MKLFVEVADKAWPASAPRPSLPSKNEPDWMTSEGRVSEALFPLVLVPALFAAIASPAKAGAQINLLETILPGYLNEESEKAATKEYKTVEVK
jgi:hypothetical protein